LAEVHGNRTHLGGYQPPTLDLKSRRPTSDLRTSAGAKISKGLMNVKMIPQLVSVSLSPTSRICAHRGPFRSIKSPRIKGPATRIALDEQEK
jgi:hypothetical protein